MNLKETGGFSVKGHLKINDITDKDNPIELVNKSNAIHNGNMVFSIAKQLVGQDSNNTHAFGWFCFGDGGSIIQQTGQVTYRPTNTSDLRSEIADLYNRTFQKRIGDEGLTFKVSPVIYAKAIADININVILQTGEPFGQLPMDNSIEYSDKYVFDEIGIFSNAESVNDANLLTHVVFHPVQKALNRVLEVDYTIRIEIV